MKPTPQRILVFGTTGEIGGRVARDCALAGHTVFGVSRGQNTRHRPDLSGVQLLQGDRADETFLHETLAPLRPDVVIDTVPTRESVERYLRHFPGVRNVFLCGSTGVYVPLRQLPADETHPWREDTGVNFHRQSVRDAYALELWETAGFPVTIFQPTNIIGPGRVPLELWGGRDISFYRRLKAGEPVLIPDCGKVAIQSGYNDDLAQAFVLALNTPDAVRGKRFIISCRRAIPLERYLETAMDALQSRSAIRVVSREELMAAYPEIQWKNRLEFLMEPMCFDIGLAERTFGYAPSRTTEEGLRAALAWCEAEGLL